MVEVALDSIPGCKIYESKIEYLRLWMHKTKYSSSFLKLLLWEHWWDTIEAQQMHENK